MYRGKNYEQSNQNGILQNLVTYHSSLTGASSSILNDFRISRLSRTSSSRTRTWSSSLRSTSRPEASCLISSLRSDLKRRKFEPFVRDSQCDQIRRFFESSWQQKFYQKKPKWLATFWAILKKPHSYVKTALSTFWTTFGKNWANFYSNIWSHSNR